VAQLDFRPLLFQDHVECSIAMPKPKEEKPLLIRCPNCKQVREPDFNETTRRYVCSICSEPVDAQVLIEKRKRGLK
jgi:DNA-directed RNA polymerase subunit RPC12/RpoP